MVIRTSDNLLVNIDNVEYIRILNCANTEYKIVAMIRSGKEIIVGNYNTKEQCDERFNMLCTYLNAKSF